ncbi:phage portal protein [Burkholderia cepacia]|uniref:Phage portal protein n=1 Tax=Burkholderia contaminans TaxID=488447 RepID=A0A2S5E7L5_9BURK|nr:phage portal protein [Burkholderia cepacia]EKS9801364.1 phage portal protein [Burkholderia cepacia]EKS9816787.1 phage portal protein [Burkholderia cepacia]OXI56586.1 phage portal protein [Burkholderia sp. AU27893]POZ87381.1 phage portal protein [Burkholderia contaminans]
MSAHASIPYCAVPERLVISAIRDRNGMTRADLIAFDECPSSGEITETEHGTQISFPWPRNRTMRHAVGDWLTHSGINFTVVV